MCAATGLVLGVDGVAVLMRQFLVVMRVLQSGCVCVWNGLFVELSCDWFEVIGS